MRQLTDDEVVDLLLSNGTGVLAVNDWNGQTPHPFPVAYGYQDEQDLFVMQLEGDDTSHKKRCLQRDRNVAFTVYEETEPGELWRSAIVKGELVDIDYGDAEPALAVLAQNTTSAPNPVRWGDSSTVTPFELDIDEWSGRAFDIE
jgi:nitroimidazol reductase NimA-like FMN-containing flavoprotein (pyridoxamine 5'-phosphate oxidase superfamily)